MQHKRINSVQVYWNHADIRRILFEALYEPHECNEIRTLVEWMKKIKWKLEENAEAIRVHTFLLWTCFINVFHSSRVEFVAHRQRHTMRCHRWVHLRPFSRAERCSHNQLLSMGTSKLLCKTRLVPTSYHRNGWTDIILVRKEDRRYCYSAGNRLQVYWLNELFFWFCLSPFGKVDFFHFAQNAFIQWFCKTKNWIFSFRWMQIEWNCIWSARDNMLSSVINHIHNSN